MGSPRFFIFLLALPFLTLLQSCKLMEIAPLSPAPGPQNILSAFATIGTASDFEGPSGIQCSGSHLWVANFSTYLQEWNTTGGPSIIDIWTYNSGVPFDDLYGVGIDKATGNVYTCDISNNRIVVFDSTGNYLAVFGDAEMSVSTPAHPTGMLPYGMAVNSSGTTVYALCDFPGDVLVYTIGGSPSAPTYTYQYDFGSTGTGPATLSRPSNLRVDDNGNVWVADTGNHRLAEYSGTGNFLKAITLNGLDVNFTPSDVMLDASGQVYAVDSNGNVVVKFTPSGKAVGQFGKGTLQGPQCITEDGSGNFYVTNQEPQQIVVFH